MNPPFVRASGEGVLLLVYVQPGASRSEIKGQHEERLKIRVRAAAVEGAANEALLDFLQKTLRCKRKDLEILRGEKSRSKDILLRNGSLESVLTLIQAL